MYMYYMIHTYISHLQLHFAYINTNQVFLSAAKAIAMLNTCCTLAGVQNHSLSKHRIVLSFFLSFFPSQQKVYSVITSLYDKRLSSENTVFTTIWEDKRSKFIHTKIDQKAYRGSTGCVLPAILVSDRWNTRRYCKRMRLHRFPLSPCNRSPL